MYPYLSINPSYFPRFNSSSANVVQNSNADAETLLD